MTQTRFAVDSVLPSGATVSEYRYRRNAAVSLFLRNCERYSLVTLRMLPDFDRSIASPETIAMSVACGDVMRRLQTA